MNKMQSDSAKMAFKFYYLNPMSYNDGKNTHVQVCLQLSYHDRFNSES